MLMTTMQDDSLKAGQDFEDEVVEKVASHGAFDVDSGADTVEKALLQGSSKNETPPRHLHPKNEIGNFTRESIP